jgi:hypothetical protein
MSFGRLFFFHPHFPISCTLDSHVIDSGRDDAPSLQSLSLQAHAPNFIAGLAFIIAQTGIQRGAIPP